MYIIDIIIACLLGYSLYKGFRNGLVISLVSLVSLVAGIFIALKFSFLLRDYILKATQWNANMVTLVAFVLTFLGVLILIHQLGKILTRVIKTLALGGVNRLAGAVFEGLKMILIISVVFNIFQKLNFNNLLVSEETLSQSLFYIPIESTSKKVFPLMEEWYKIALEKTGKEVQDFKQKQSVAE